MTQEEKDLLVKDLSARIPYKVKASYYGTDEEMECTDIVEGVIIDNNDAEIIIGQYGLSVEKVKPYLFPMSSMIEEQALELEKIDPEFYSLISGNGNIYVSMDIRGYDWLLKNNFDFRGLIPMGLAKDATGLNIY